MAGGLDTMKLFIRRGLEGILAEATARRMTELKSECRKALASIDSDANADAGRGGGKRTSGVMESGLSDDQADGYFLLYFPVLRMACGSRQPKIVQPALDCLQKLIAYGFLRGRTPDTAEPTRTLMDHVIDTIAGCFDAERGGDKNVQLQILKALLPAVQSPNCEVHEASLLKTVRVCYEIFLDSRDPVVQSTGRAIISQILDTVFARMESLGLDSTAPAAAGAAVAAATAVDAAPDTRAKDADDSDGGDQGDDGNDDVDGGDASAGDDPGASDASPRSPVASLLDQVIATAISTASLADTAAASGDSSAAADAPDGDGPGEEQRVEELMNAVSQARAEEEARVAASAATASPLGARKSKKHAGGAPGTPASPTAVSAAAAVNAAAADQETMQEQASNAAAFANVRQRDAFLVFKALCKLSLKGIPDGASADSHELRSKVLSLEMLASIVRSSGPVFRQHPQFVAAVRQYLFMSLLRNGVSTVPEVFQLSLDIFSLLAHSYRYHLRGEIGVFCTNILLHIIESPNSPMRLKNMALRCIRNLCTEPQLLVDLFVNFDCDVTGGDVFERFVGICARVAQGKVADRAPGSNSSAAAVAAAEELAQHRLVALRALADLVGAMNRHVDPLVAVPDDDASVSANGHAGGSDAGDAVVTPAQDGATLQRSSSDGLATPVLPGGDPAGAGAAGAASEDGQDLDVFAAAKQRKQIIDEGVARFNVKAKKGVAYFIKHGILEEGNAAQLARMFHTLDTFDKHVMGDYMGELDDFAKSVMYAYVDQMDFTGAPIDIAIRTFLSGFRLPGEAQKIDRMMEKFAERYCLTNPGTFANADTAYVLAFSIVMLATDAHSPQITRKMTLEEFRRNNSGIDDGNDLDPELLEQIYNRVKEQPLKLKDDLSTLAALSSQNSMTSKARQQQYAAEAEMMLKTSQDVLASKKGRVAMQSSSDPRIVHHMFQPAWAPVLATFSVLLEKHDDADVIEACLNGLTAAIRIASVFFMDTERNAFVTSLSKFTHLSSQRAIGAKNVECIRALLRVARSTGDYLSTSWQDVLHCISEVNRLHLLASGAVEDAEFLRPSAARGRRGAQGTQMEGYETDDEHRLASITFMAQRIDPAVIDDVFVASQHLSADAIVDFTRHLCHMSWEEINAPNPRIFLLKKLVEVADVNMGRVRLIWSRMWSVMCEHFIQVSVGQFAGAALFAIDALRQLAMKFFEKDELSHYHFQKEFLRPFEYILTHSSNVELRRLVVECLQQMLQARGQKIRSGWKSMLLCFSAAASDVDETTVSMAFRNVETVLQDDFALVVEAGAFADAVNCVIAFADNPRFPDISLQAIEFVQFAVDQLTAGRVYAVSSGAGGDGDDAPRHGDGDAAAAGADAAAAGQDDEMHMRYWIPILLGLARLVGHLDVAVRHKALETLFGVLRAHGDVFSVPMWKMVFKGVLFPIFDDVRHADPAALTAPMRRGSRRASLTAAAAEGNGAASPSTAASGQRELVWLQTTSLKALQALVRLFAQHLAVVRFLLPDLLDLLSSCVTRHNEVLTRIGLACLLKLLLEVGADLTSDELTRVTGVIAFLFDETMPRELVPGSTDEEWFQLDGGVHEDAPTRAPGHAVRDSPVTPRKQAAGEGSLGSTPQGTPGTPTQPHDLVAHPAHAVSEDALEGVLMRKTVIKAKAIAQTELIRVVNDAVVTMYASMSTAQLRTLLDAVEASYRFARSFNANTAVRSQLSRVGLMGDDSVPNLNKQETTGIQSFLRVLFLLYGDTSVDAAERNAIAEGRIVVLLRDVIETYSRCTRADATSAERKTASAWRPAVWLIINGVNGFSDAQFRKHVPGLYPMLLDLMMSGDRDILLALRALLIRTSQVFGFAAPVTATDADTGGDGDEAESLS